MVLSLPEPQRTTALLAANEIRRVMAPFGDLGKVAATLIVAEFSAEP